MLWNKIKTVKLFYWLVGLGTVFFLSYLFLYIKLPISLTGINSNGQINHLILNQPDEAINYFFIKQLVFDNNFRFSENLSLISNNQVHPRSTTVIYGQIVPIGFPGIIFIFSYLLSFLVLIFGNFNFFAVCLTPFFAVLSVFFFFGFWKKIFNEKIAFISSSLLFVLPAFWYYASRPFQHHILFVLFLIVGLYFGAVALEKTGWKRFLAIFGFAVFFSLTVYVRPAEFVWIAVLGFILLFLSRKKWKTKDLLPMFSGIFVIAILFFATQILFYGNFFGTGYAVPNADGSSGSIFNVGRQGIYFLKNIILPFGFNLKNILYNTSVYLIFLSGLWSIFTILGLILFFYFDKKEKKPEYFLQKKYFIIFLSLTIYLAIFYGSWKFTDNLLGWPSIGTSYVRYFLPVYIFALPFLAIFLNKIYNWKKWCFFIIIFILFLNSVYSVFFALEGLLPVKKAVNNYYSYREKVYNIAEPNAIIVTRYGDKYLFPGRKIIAGFANFEQKQAIVDLVRSGQKVYMFDLPLNLQEKKDLEEFLTSNGIKISEPLILFDNLELRKIQ